jgi:ATP-dependent Clp protease ATP-binding subunit ClpC
MFERYTESARRVLFFARYEASQDGSIAIEPEHLLLGILRGRPPLIRDLLAPVRPNDLREDLDRRTPLAERLPTSVEIPFTPPTKQVLGFAAEEADRLRHSYIGTEHLLLGLLRVEGSTAASILIARGVELNAVREKVVGLTDQKRAGAESPGGTNVRQHHISAIRLSLEHLAQELQTNAEARELLTRILGDLDALSEHLET